MASIRERWIKNPHCQKCGCLTELPSKYYTPLPNTATLEHIYPKDHSLRKGTPIILYCYQCNQLGNELWRRTRLLYSEHTFVLNQSVINKLKPISHKLKSWEIPIVIEENRKILNQLFSLKL
jgi:hypothetical protein